MSENTTRSRIKDITPSIDNSKSRAVSARTGATRPGSLQFLLVQCLVHVADHLGGGLEGFVPFVFPFRRAALDFEISIVKQ